MNPITRAVLTLAAGATLTVAMAPCAQAESIYCTFRGQKQGAIKGDRGLNGDDTLIPIQTLGQSVTSPRDPQSGLPTGRRQYQPLQIQKSLDSASPLLFMMMVTNENLPTVVCNFYRTRNTPVGQMVTNAKPYFSIKLTNASLASHELAGNGSLGNEHETLTLTFQKIELTDLQTGTNASDDWETRY